jgi:hypothetical protein
MTMTTTRSAMPRPAGLQLLHDISRGAPFMTWHLFAMLALGAVCVALSQFDVRLINGVSVWAKPAKFHISLAVQFATVAWGLSFLPADQRARRSVQWPLVVMLVLGWLELLYITVQAARGEASHFNQSTWLYRALYTLMGVGATAMLLIAMYFGARLWRHRAQGLWTEAAAVGLFWGGFLGLAAGFYLGGQTGHHVGAAVSDAAGTGLFSWSTQAGDLRVAHFVGMHAAQIIPFAALNGRRSLVYGVALLMTLGTVGTFVQALLGIPLFRA